MRNLKKILSLVLALMMVLSVMVTASAAFTDAEDIEYTEAVEVMTAIGLISGNPDGSFKPEGTLVREEAAKMAAYLLIGKSVNDLAQSKTTFTDVPVGHWSNPYVAYCVKEGLINGRNETTFDPRGTVTGYEYAKLMLCALGIEGVYTGANWTVDVALNAKTYGLLAGMEIVLSNNITREQAAQMTLNAATYTDAPTTWDLVDTASANRVIKTFSDLVEATLYATFLNGDGSRYNVVETPVTACLLNTVHKMAVNYGARDTQGRPGTSYTSKTAALFYAYAPVVSWTDGYVTLKALYSALPTAGDVAGTVVIDKAYLDGVLDDTDTTMVKTDFAASTGGYIGGYGASMEVYATATPGVYDFVQAYEYFAQVASVNNKDIDGKLYATVSVPGGATYAYYNTDVAVGDFLVVTVGKLGVADVLYSVAEPTVVPGVATWRNDYYVTLGGTTYDYSDVALNVVTASNVTAKDELYLFLNSYGNILYAYAPSAAINYAVVVDTDSETTLFGGEQWYAKVVYADGTTDTVKYYNAGVIEDYTLKTFTTAYGQYFFGTPVNGYQGGAVQVRTNTTYATGGSFLANDNTVYVVETVNPLTGAKTYTTYTGVSKVPNLNAAGYAYVQNVTGVNAGYAKVVWLFNATPATAADTSNLIYVSALSQDKQTDTDRGTYYNYLAIVGGEITDIDVVLGQEIDAGFYTTTTSANGLITSLSGEVAAPYAEIHKTGIRVPVVGNTIHLDATSASDTEYETYYYTADTVVYVDYAGQAIIKMTVAEFVASAYYTATTWEVSAITIGNVLTTIVVHL